MRTSFEIRFCVLDLDNMVFKYAKSPKEKFQEWQEFELINFATGEQWREKPIKLSNHNKNKHELTYIFSVLTKNRIFTFSAMSRTELALWHSGFKQLFLLKEVYVRKRQREESVIN